MKYEILSADNTTTLVGMVNSFIDQGWKPLGGLIIDFKSVHYIYHQTMIYEPPTQFLGPK